MDTREAEKVDALQPEPSMGEAGQHCCWGQVSKSIPSQMGNKSLVTRKMGSIKDSTSVLVMANYVESRRTKVNRKELKIDRTMEYGESQLIDCDHVADVKEDLLANPADGRLQLLVSEDKGMGMPLHNSISVTAFFACRVLCAMLLYSQGALLVIGGQHGVAACDEICKEVTARMGEVEEWMTNFDVRMIKFDTSVEMRRKLAGQHNKAQHGGSESTVAQILNNFYNWRLRSRSVRRQLSR